MAVKQSPKLADILARFREAQTKVAMNGMGMDPAPAVPTPDPAGAPVEDAATTSADVAAAAEALEAASENADAAEAAAEEAKAQVVDAKDALKEVADELINEHTASVTQDAQTFGEVFALSFMESMNKTAAANDLATQAYEHTMNVLTNNLVLEKTAAIYESAYKMAMAKLAGFDDVDELQSAVGAEDELTPEQLAELAIAAQEEVAGEEPEVEDPEVEAMLEGMSEDELAELAAIIADDGDAGEVDPEDISEDELAQIADIIASGDDGGEEAEASPEDVANAANMLAAAREGDLGEELAGEGDEEDIDLPKMAQDAYAHTMSALGLL